jgi:hypothetical protein
MNKVYVSDDIFYIENFIDKEDLEKLSYFMKDKNGLKPWPNSIHLTKSFFQNNESESFYKKYKEKCSLLLSDKEYTVFPDQVLKYSQSNIGDWAFYPHADAYDIVNTEGDIPIWAYVLYLNEDYEGGEIVYTVKNITLKPKAGTIIVHSSSEACTHGVKAILSGERFVIAGFVFNSKNPD